VIVSAAVTFLVTMLLLLASRKRDLAASDAAFGAAITQTEANKGKSSALLDAMAAQGKASTPLQNIVFACDAGMGSSAMGASVLRKKLQKAGVEGVTVTNKAIANLDGTEDLIITHQDLTDRARQQNPKAVHVSVDNFMGSPKYDEVVDQLAAQSTSASK